MYKLGDSAAYIIVCEYIGKTITPYELGKIMNIKPEVYRRWKLGTTKPSLALIRDIGIKYSFDWEQCYMDIYSHGYKNR